MKTVRLAALVAAAAVAAPVGGAAALSPTVRLAIVHTLHGCHTWSAAGKELGPNAKIRIKRGTKLEIRMNCPMDFDFAQTAGPPLVLGDLRTHAGTVRTILFRRAGVYRLTATNVQSSAEIGLQTLGADSSLALTIVVS